MIIKTITCHDVYNVGASLQAYALATYLKKQGHEVEIIDYKPEYLSRHYSLSWVNNPRFDRPFLREAFLLAKLPARLAAKYGERKKRFDAFRKEYLPLTKRYNSFEALQSDPPAADAYIAGSDQIWNPLFQNGKDPAFFLQFAPPEVKRLSYAASFAVESMDDGDAARMTPWLQSFDAISVRETSGAEMLQSMALDGVAVCDPVFLLDRKHWEHLATSVEDGEKDYILVYDFENNPAVEKLAKSLSKKYGKPIVSVFPMFDADEVWNDLGPREFLGAIKNASVVVSNSFHATAFSMIFEKEFYVVERTEGINARMRDLLADAGLPERMVKEETACDPIDWQAVGENLAAMTTSGKRFLQEQL